MRPPLPHGTNRSSPVERPSVKSLKRRRRGIGIGPIAVIAILLYLLVLVYPLLAGAFLSFTNASPLGGTFQFIGIKNYVQLFGDTQLGTSLLFTGITALAVTVIANLVGLLFALLLNKPTRNFRLMRTLIFIPQVLSGIVVGFIWRSIFTSDGLLNSVLINLHIIKAPVSWIGNPTLATACIMLVVIWTTTAFSTVVFSASLTTVPLELYEAARMDGANAFRRFTNVTWPMIAPGLTICVTLSLITSFKLYDVIAALTGGGPFGSTESAAYYVIQEAFTNNFFGYSSAIAVVLLLLTAAVAFAASALLRRRESQI
jgi:ABC-type sugar transport system permease subunit